MFAAQDGATPNDKLYVDDVFSTYLYTGNGSTQTINNGIDLAGKGGMVWTKDRDDAYSHAITDTVRGNTKVINSDLAQAEQTKTDAITAFNSDGYALGADASWWWNKSTRRYVSWTFRKAARFFDVVTYTGNGVSGRTIAHSLGAAPGMLIVKCTSTTGSWKFYHSQAGVIMELNSTAASNVFTGGYAAGTSASVFTLYQSSGDISAVNTDGATYVAYLFASDTSADGLIQCGSFATDGSGQATVTLGWEPQYVLVKPSSTSGDWRIIDSMRGWDTAGYRYIRANTSAVEVTYGGGNGLTATGFSYGGVLSATHIYLAIRRPNKPPTSGTQVYNAIARTGTGAAATVTGVGFAPDSVLLHSRSGTTGGRWEDRLRGATQELVAETNAIEAAVAESIKAFDMDGFSLGTDGDWNTNTATYINWCFKRAPGVFDIVCYTGANQSITVAHNLTVSPEFILFCIRSSGGWYVSTNFNDNSYDRYWFDQTNYSQTPYASYTAHTSRPTASSLFLGNYYSVSAANTTYVAYLFATKAGISKVGSYTGNGSAQTISCGFTTGARFVLIKRADSTGDWYVWDTTRGIVAGNDSHLSLNSTAAEVTGDDSIDPDASGFIVNQVAATNVNVNTATYIFLAFA